MVMYIVSLTHTAVPCLCQRDCQSGGVTRTVRISKVQLNNKMADTCILSHPVPNTWVCKCTGVCCTYVHMCRWGEKETQTINRKTLEDNAL